MKTFCHQLDFITSTLLQLPARYWFHLRIDDSSNSTNIDQSSIQNDGFIGINSYEDTAHGITFPLIST